MPEPAESTLTAASAVSVRDVMSPGIISISSETTVGACASTMYERRTHAVLVLDSRTRQPRGWVFHYDILEHLGSDPLTTLAGDVVSQEASYVDPETSVDEAAARMRNESVTHLLVAKSEDAIPEGVLSTWDIVAHYARPWARRG